MAAVVKLRDRMGGNDFIVEESHGMWLLKSNSLALYAGPLPLKQIGLLILEIVKIDARRHVAAAEKGKPAASGSVAKSCPVGFRSVPLVRVLESICNAIVNGK